METTLATKQIEPISRNREYISDRINTTAAGMKRAFLNFIKATTAAAAA
jgi:hypothetical protein